jgi:LmbE family N-acetylglucosaminyl deacetylase
MQWIYLSPHFDDVALSCGGVIWDQSRAGVDVNIWTICAGDPPSGEFSALAQKLHSRWETGSRAIEKRRIEDINACQILQASYFHFDIPDCIYRKNNLSTINEVADTNSDQLFLYPSEEKMFGEIHANDEQLILSLSDKLKEMIPNDAVVVSPFGLGGHVDHIFTRKAIERLAIPILYYMDYPYVLGSFDHLKEVTSTGWRNHHFKISDEGIEFWLKSILAHESQINTFWKDEEELRESLFYYLGFYQGIVFWEKY